MSITIHLWIFIAFLLLYVIICICAPSLEDYINIEKYYKLKKMKKQAQDSELQERRAENEIKRQIQIEILKIKLNKAK